MPWWVALLTDSDSVSHVVFVYGLVIALGLALGRVRIFGVSLGISWVLFVGLAAGHAGFALNATMLGFARDFGLILFVYFLGLQVGPSFFSAFKTGGIQLNVLAILAVFFSIAITIGLFFLSGALTGLNLPQFLGVYFGAITNTPGLGAAQEALSILQYKGDDIAIAYASAYPLGLIGSIAACILLRYIYRIDVKNEEIAWEKANRQSDAPVFFQVRISNPALVGLTLKTIRAIINRPFIFLHLFRGSEPVRPSDDTTLELNDRLSIVSQRKAKRSIVTFCGEERSDSEQASEEKTGESSSRVILVTRKSVNGARLEEFMLKHSEGVQVTRIYRAGMELFPANTLHLQLGDQLVCMGSEKALSRFEQHLGNQLQKLDNPNLMSVFFGIALGVILGSIPIMLPMLPIAVKLGLAGGPLIVAILLSYTGPKMRLVTYTTHSANLMLREFGMALFMASVGLSAGERFVANLINGNGLIFMALGLVITVLTVLFVGISARQWLKLNYHSILGLVAGATTNAVTLAYANELSDKNIPSIAYATVYPFSLFLRILSGQLVLLLFWSYV